jgi:membrane fusion protein, copper/silver efflux system
MKRMRETRGRLVAAARGKWQQAPERLRRVAPLLVVLLIGLVIGSTVFGRGSAPDPDGRDGIAGASGDHDHGDGVEWTCAMHPQIRQPGPGQCPICGMDLVPVITGDDLADEGVLPRLTVSNRAAALMAVQVWPAERRGLTSDVRLSGSISYDETQVHDVVLRTEGQIERLYVNYEQAAVRRGQRLADIYSPAIVAASQELLQARRSAERGGMPELVEAAAAQLLALGVSRGQVDRILDTGEPARAFTLYSPGDGVVAELAGRQGEWLMAGGRLMRVAGLGRVWVQFDAYERDLARLRVGQHLQFTVEAFPGEVFAGPIAFIDAVVDGGRRTARVRVQVDNPGLRLKPGMLARGQAASAGGGGGAGDGAIVIPATAPLVTGQRALVYVQLPGLARPTFEPREVTLGARHGAHREVTSGLAEGELVVVNGAFRIDSELQIRGRPSMMGGPPVQHDHGAAGPGGAPNSGIGDIPDRGRVPIQLSAAAGRQLEAVMVAYLDVAGALSRDDAGAARAAARTLDRALVAAELTGLGSDEARAWARIRGGMRQRAARMATASDLEGLRRDLLPLSELAERAILSFRSDQVGPIFRAVCPMVNGMDGIWLTRVEAVENPYYGADMFDCGEVQEKVG